MRRAVFSHRKQFWEIRQVIAFRLLGVRLIELVKIFVPLRLLFFWVRTDPSRTRQRSDQCAVKRAMEVEDDEEPSRVVGGRSLKGLGSATQRQRGEMMRRNVGELLFCHRLNQVVEFIGGRTRTRTWDPLIKSQLLY